MSGTQVDTWFVRSRGKILGPFAFRQLETLRDQGRLAKFDEISHGGKQSWVRASTHPELFPPAHTGDIDFNIDLEEITAVEAADSPVWHYMNGPIAFGPVPLAELLQLANTGVLQAETLVWTTGMADWVAAKTVPALQLDRPIIVVDPFDDSKRNSKKAITAPEGRSGFSIAGFVLGIVGLFSAFFAVLSAVSTAHRQADAELLAIISLVSIVAWPATSLFAVIFGSVGMSKALRDDKRRGLGLGITALVLGVLELVTFAVLMLIVMLGIAALRR